MYDTVSVLWREASPKFIEAFDWTGYKSSRSERGVRETWSGGPKGGPHVILHPDGVVKVERSLPKALTGQNAIDLRQDDVTDAIAAVDLELRALVPGVDVPSIGTMQPCRVDYCESIDLGDAGLVDLALERLAGTRVARKGYPIRGESGSVSWPRGALRLKAYNKGREDGEAAHRSMLRVEPALYGIGAFRVLPSVLRHDDPTDRIVTLRHVLTADVRSSIFARVWALLGGIPVGIEEMNDVEFVGKFVAFFGLRRASAIIGYCAVWSLAGIREPRDVSDENRPTYYRVIADIRRFRDAHAEVAAVALPSEDWLRWVARKTGVAA